jgi:hypothetical protein
MSAVHIITVNVLFRIHQSELVLHSQVHKHIRHYLAHQVSRTTLSVIGLQTIEVAQESRRILGKTQVRQRTE